MAALTAVRTSAVREITFDVRPLAANAKVWKGALAICLLSGTSKGYYQQGAAVNGVVVGRFTETVDNTAGADGALSANIDFFHERHLFLLANDAAGLIAVANREAACYALDDQTASINAGPNARLGVVYDVTTEGVWVEVGVPAAGASSITSGTSTLVAGTKVVTAPITANSVVLVSMRDPGAGAIPAFAALDVPVGTRVNGVAGSFTVNAIDNTKALIASAICTFDYVIIG